MGKATIVKGGFNYFRKMFHLSPFGIFISLLLIYVLLNITLIYGSRFTKTITIKEKYIRAGQRSRYRVVDQDDNVYELGDSFFLMEFDSADDYAKIDVNSSYKVYGYWFRLPIFSWFPIIYKFDKK